MKESEKKVVTGWFMIKARGKDQEGKKKKKSPAAREKCPDQTRVKGG